VLICCWASDLRPALAQSALDGFDPNANGQIRVVVVQPDGKILIGGDFTTLSPNGGAAVTRNRIARLNPDGTLDTAFDPNANNFVYSIAVQADGKVLVGGQFSGASSIGGLTRNRIARLDATTGLADSFDPNANDIVISIAVQSDGKILAGGQFSGASSIGGLTRNFIARLDPTTGAADSFNPNANNLVRSISVQADGKILAGGDFTNIGGLTRNFIARLDPTTGAADSFNPNANALVRSISVQADGRVLAGGNFTNIGGQPRNFIARLDATAGAADSLNPNANDGVFSIAVQSDGKILVGGNFNGANGIGGQSRNFIARLDPTTGLADSFDPNANGLVFSIAVQADGKILIGGFFTSLSPNGGAAVTRNRIARLNPDGTLDASIDPNANFAVLPIAVQVDGKILIGGDFTSLSPNGGAAVTRNRIARLNPDGTLDASFDPNANREVDAIAVQADGRILMGGGFITLSPNGGAAVTRNGIARLNPDGTLDASFDPNANGNVFSIAVQADGKILIVGGFTSLSPNGGAAVTRNRIARLNPDGTLDASFNPNANNGVFSIAVQADGEILIGGFFTTLSPNGGAAVTRNYIARLNPDGTLDASFNPNANSLVFSMAVQADGKILIGGSFTSLSPNGGAAVTRNFIARLNTDGTLDAAFDPNANNGVDSIAVQADGKILIGGQFGTLSPNGGAAVTRNRIARLNPDGTLDASFDPNANSQVYSIAVQADGKILIGGAFTTLSPNGGAAVTRNHIARLSNDTAALQNLAATQTTVTWTRGGASPQFHRVTFEYSTDNVSYSTLGNGTASGSNWTLTGLSLSTGKNIYVRARGYYSGGYENGSESITETVRNAFLAGPTAAGSTISGTVTTIDRAPLGGVIVSLAGSGSGITMTNSAGFYAFPDLTSGGFYTVTPWLANYSFGPQARSFSLLADQTDASFTATPNATPTENPLDTPLYFVRQQYLDFLGREPDQEGLDYWSGQLNQCHGHAACLSAQRIEVSAAFFASAEFQQSGSFVYRVYKAGLGRQLSYAEFTAARTQVLGGTSPQASQATFANAFVEQPEFVQKFQANVTAQSFVGALLAQISASSQVDLSPERNQMIATYQTGGSMNDSRALVLQMVTADGSFQQAEYNRSFVLMEYFGYLQRDADAGGYQFWLNALNSAPGNYRGMVCSFITSTEYQRRFSSVVTHRNSECGGRAAKS
jgi:uncharacterized delta-60 repeat protein